MISVLLVVLVVCAGLVVLESIMVSEEVSVGVDFFSVGDADSIIVLSEIISEDSVEFDSDIDSSI